MTGAMYAAVAGLRAHMNALNVIGNNVANVNTNAYKSSRYVFDEALYTNYRAGANGTDTTGGVNPAQIGYGANVGTIDIDMSTKNYQPTGRPGDVAIDGDGFLLVGDKDLGPFTSSEDAKALYLTRRGDLGFDESGYLVDGSGQVVYGWLNVQSEERNPNAGTDQANAYYQVARVLTPIRLPMALSNGDAIFPIGNDGTPGTVTDASTATPGIVELEDGVTVTNKRVLLDSLTISKNGQISGVTKESGEVIVVGYIAIGQVDNPNGVTHVDGHYYQALDGSGNLHINSIGGVVKSPTGDDAEDDDVPHDGITVGDAGKTELVPNGLETSGTDLATEISNMIMMQRGYQANTRIITVTDSMLEELVNMKR